MLWLNKKKAEKKKIDFFVIFGVTYWKNVTITNQRRHTTNTRTYSSSCVCGTRKMQSRKTHQNTTNGTQYTRKKRERDRPNKNYYRNIQFDIGSFRPLFFQKLKHFGWTQIKNLKSLWLVQYSSALFFSVSNENIILFWKFSLCLSLLFFFSSLLSLLKRTTNSRKTPSVYLCFRFATNLMMAR